MGAWATSVLMLCGLISPQHRHTRENHMNDNFHHCSHLPNPSTSDQLLNVQLRDATEHMLAQPAVREGFIRIIQSLFNELQFLADRGYSDLLKCTYVGSFFGSAMFTAAARSGCPHCWLICAESLAANISAAFHQGHLDTLCQSLDTQEPPL